MMRVNVRFARGLLFIMGAKLFLEDATAPAACDISYICDGTFAKIQDNRKDISKLCFKKKKIFTRKHQCLYE